MTVIETRRLTKTFQGTRRIPGIRGGTEPVTAIQDLNLAIEKGEVFGFLGPNGAGKSTTINILLDYVRPTTGTATVLGRDAQEDTLAIHDDIGVLPEQLALWERLTAQEHVRIASDAKAVSVDPATQLRRVGLIDAANRKTGTFSTGMRQRLGLAMALVGNPDLLILDEPTAGLDPNGVQRLRDIIATEVDRGATVFLSSHVLQEVESICDRVAILRDGNLVAVDTVEGLRADVGAGIEIRIRLDEVTDGLTNGLEEIAGVTDAVSRGNELFATCRDDSAKVAVLNAVKDGGGTIKNFDVKTAGLEALFESFAGENVDVTAGSSESKPGAPGSGDADQEIR